MLWHSARYEEDLLEVLQVVEKSHQNKKKSNEGKQRINKNKKWYNIYDEHTSNNEVDD